MKTFYSPVVKVIEHSLDPTNEQSLSNHNLAIITKPFTFNLNPNNITQHKNDGWTLLQLAQHLMSEEENREGGAPRQGVITSNQGL